MPLSRQRSTFCRFYLTFTELDLPLTDLDLTFTDLDSRFTELDFAFLTGGADNALGLDEEFRLDEELDEELE